MAEPAVFDWAAHLQACGLLLIQAAAWTFCTRALVHALGFIGR